MTEHLWGLKNGGVKVKVKGSQSCPTLWDSRDYTGLGILQAGILEWVSFPFSKGSSQPRSPALEADCLPTEPQGSRRILEWAAYPFSSGSPQLRNQTGVSCIAGGFFTNWAIWSRTARELSARKDSPVNSIPRAQDNLETPRLDAHLWTWRVGVSI